MATRNIVPRANGEGSIGTAVKHWGNGYFDELNTEKVVADDVVAKGPVVDVRAFGAKGNGVTDDTAAIQTAIDSSSTVIIPEGVYVISQPLIIDVPITLLGVSQSNVKIKYIGNPSVLTGIIQIAKNAHVNNLHIKNVQILSINKSNTIGLDIGTGASNLTDSTIKNVRINNVDVGIKAAYSWCDIFENVRVHVSNKPFDLTSQTNNILFNKCNFTGYTQIPGFTNCQGITMLECSFENGVGLFSMWNSYITFIDPYFEYITQINDYRHISCNGGVLTIIGGDVNASWAIEKIGTILNLDESTFYFNITSDYKEASYETTRNFNQLASDTKMRFKNPAIKVASFSVYKPKTLSIYSDRGALQKEDGVIAFKNTAEIFGSQSREGITYATLESNTAYVIKYKVKTMSRNLNGVHFVLGATTTLDGDPVNGKEKFGLTDTDFVEREIYIYNPYNARSLTFSLRELNTYIESIDVYKVGAGMIESRNKVYYKNAPTGSGFEAGDTIYNEAYSTSNTARGWTYNGSTWVAF